MSSFYLIKSGNRISVFIKNLFFLMIFTLLSLHSVYAQCKLEKLEDNYSDTQTYYTKDVKLSSAFPLMGSKEPWDLVISFMMVDNTYTIQVTHQSQKYSSSLNSIFFNFEDGTAIKMEKPDSDGDYNTGFGYSYTFTTFILNKDELNTFASKDLSRFQANFSHFPDYPVVEEAIKKKSVDRIRKDASCILSEANSKTETPKTPKDKCKYEKDVIDDFTKERIVVTTRSVISISEAGSNFKFTNVAGTNKNGINGLEFTWGCNYIELPQYNEVALLLENGEILSLKDSEPSELVKTTYYFSTKLFTIDNDSIWMKLKTTPLTKARLFMNSKDLGTIEVEKKNASAFMKAINCIDILAIPKPK